MIDAVLSYISLQESINILYGQVIEWSIEPDCKSVLNVTMVKIHPFPLLWRLKCTGGTQALILMQLYSYIKLV